MAHFMCARDESSDRSEVDSRVDVTSVMSVFLTDNGKRARTLETNDPMWEANE